MLESVPTNPPIIKILEYPGAKEAYNKLRQVVGQSYLDLILLSTPVAPQGHHKPEKEAQKLKKELEALAASLTSCVYQLEKNPACEDVRIKTRHFTYKGVRLTTLMRQAGKQITLEAQQAKLLWLFDECHYGALRLLERIKHKTKGYHYEEVSRLLHARMWAAGLRSDEGKKLWCSPDALKMMVSESKKNRKLWEAAGSAL